MATTKMLNFRVKDAELRSIDLAAKQAGMNRSDFIRFAIDKALKDTLPEMKVSKVPKQTTKPKCPQGQDPRTCQAAVWVKLPTGVRQCQTCGIKKG